MWYKRSNINLHECICAVISPLQKKPTLEKFNPPLLHIVPSAGFPYHFSTHLGTTLQCTLLKKNKDMNYWTHFSFWRLWFTRKASLSARTPSLIRFTLRLQNIREQEMRGGSTNLFTLCKVYLVSIPHWVHKLQINSIIKLESSSSGLVWLFHKINSTAGTCSATMYARLNVWSWAWIFQGLVNSKVVHLDLDRKLSANYCSF